MFTNQIFIIIPISHDILPILSTVIGGSRSHTTKRNIQMRWTRYKRVFWLFHFIAVFQKVKSNSAGSRVYETSERIATTGEVTRPNLSHTAPVVAIRWLVDFVYSRFCRIQFNLAVYEWINSAEFQSVNLIDCPKLPSNCRFVQTRKTITKRGTKQWNEIIKIKIQITILAVITPHNLSPPFVAKL